MEAIWADREGAFGDGNRCDALRAQPPELAVGQHQAAGHATALGHAADPMTGEVRRDRAPADAGGAGAVAAAKLSGGRGGMGSVGTALLYLLVAAVVAAAFFGVAALVFGRGEELAPLAPDATPTRLPVGDVGGDDVRALRFQQVVRGYKMAEVDWVLDRLATELDRVGAERDDLRARVVELEARAGS